LLLEKLLLEKLLLIKGRVNGRRGRNLTSPDDWIPVRHHLAGQGWTVGRDRSRYRHLLLWHRSANTVR
jgi:hypothetical protein